jgi:tetratricopeptide (TPR) repeat protein
LSIFLDWLPQIQNNSLIVAGGILATAIEFIGFVNDRKSRDEAKLGSNANLTSSGPVRIQQKDVSVQGQQTNFADKVQGNFFSGRFDGPVAVAGGDAVDNRSSIGSINKPNGPVSQHFGDIIIPESEKLPIPRIQPPRSDFLGRDEELQEIMADFDRGATITGLRGMGGIGKTELALALAVKLNDHFPDGQFFLNMLGTSKISLKPEDAMAHIIRSYRGADAPLPEDLNGLSGLYHSVLSGKKALILLDNASSRDQVEPLLPPKGCALLVTSRNKFALPGLKEKDLDVLPLEDAKKLLLEIAGRIGDHAEELAKLCGCLPLALRNAAYALKEKPNLSVDNYIKRLGDARKRLELVEASFDLSYQLLTPELQKLWSLLSVFPADFDLAGAAAVWEMEQFPTEDALGELVKWSLVDYLPPTTDEGGRYKLHDLARDFVGSRLDDAACEPARLRHARQYQNLLWEANNLVIHGKDSLLIGLKLFDINWMNIRAAQKWASANKSMSNEIAEICSNLTQAGDILNLRLHPLKNIEWLDAALASSRSIKNQYAEENNLGSLGLAYSHLGYFQKAMEYYEQALKISREIGDMAGEEASLGNLGNIYSYLGEDQKAIEYYDPSLEISLLIGDHRGEANNLGNLGRAYFHLGEPRKAIQYYDQSLMISRQIGHHVGEEAALGNLGNAYAHLDEPRKAIKYYEPALKIAREIGDRRDEGVLLGNLGLAYFNLGEPRKAIEYYEQALKIAREIGDRRSEGSILLNMSILLYRLDQCAEAIKLAREALNIFDQMECPYPETVRKALAKWQS